MAQNVVANADALRDGIKTSGHVAVYGITFEADSAQIRAEADAALAEVTRLLKQDTELKLFVVGHTANVGDRGVGLKLSQARADAVVKRLVEKYGIQASRLIFYGVEPSSPVAANQSEVGRARNRRVEGVQQ